MANQGVADQVKGAAKETWGNAKDAARTTHDRHAAETEDAANAKREHFTDKVADLKKKGVEFTREPTTVRPGTRVCFIKAPEGVSIEVLERAAK